MGKIVKRSELKRGKPMARAAKIGVLGAAAVQRKAPARKAKMKTKQRAVTFTEKYLWSQLAALGCVACLKDGQYNPHVSIHHVDGRTKPGCHLLVLALCAPHHQHDDTDPACRIGVHPFKARFEARYGTQEELMLYSAELLEAGGAIERRT